MTPSKSLMCKFAAVVLPKHSQSDEYPHEFYEKFPKYEGDFVDLRSVGKVIELARKYYRDKDENMQMICYSDRWIVGIGGDFFAGGSAEHKHLISAIMLAVVAASRCEGL